MPDEKAIRISDAISHIDRANVIFNYVFFALDTFISTGSPAWDHRLAASANVSQLVNGDPTAESQILVTASREIAFRRLPRMLCGELVSAIETCFVDLAEIQIADEAPDLGAEQVKKAARKLNEGGPVQYLPKLAAALNMPTLKGAEWDWYTELVATRNVLVHASEPVADARYIANAGPQARALIGGSVDVDNEYLIGKYLEASGAMAGLL